ncbi:MAG: FAD-dependent oxidoreductase [Planctomycetes bacterium]|nr:FAD-dependent oxidoreductase [Planctomycetota bacterium]
MRLSRRELIAAILGTPALLAGCAAEARLPAEGELLGQSAEIGHRLRDGFRPQPTGDQWRDVQVAIVGGGASGLAAGWNLMKAGCDDFVILELEPVHGGTSRSGRSDLTRYPWGAHYIPVPLAENTRLIELLTEMRVVESVAEDGSPVVGEQFLCRDPEERLFYQGEWIEGLFPDKDASQEDLAQVNAFRKEIDRWAAWRDPSGRRAFTIPTSQSSEDPLVTDLDQISMAEWLRAHGWTSSRLHWLVDYSCRDDYGLTAEQTSAWAGLLYFVARLKAPGADHQPLITWPEGNGRIMDHLATRVGDRLQTGMAVTQISPTPDDAESTDRVNVVCFNTNTQHVGGFRARHVIFAAPQFLAPRLIEGFTERTGRRTNEFEYGSWLVANLHLSNRPRERSFPLSWDNVFHDSRSLGYVVATHQTGHDHGPTVLTWYYPYCDADARGVRELLLKATWSELADVVLADMERPHPEIRKLITRLDVFRWGHAMIRPKPGFITSHQCRIARRPDGRIHFANTDLSGIALFEEAFDHGCRASAEILQKING